MPDRPNIVFLFTDQQSHNTLSARGNDRLRTPAMDDLARRGVSFRNCYCASPVCSPARASFVTSRMPHEHGVPYNDMPIKAGLPTMGELFRDAGYETVWVGKWHTPAPYPAGEDDIPGFRNIPAPRGDFLGVSVDDFVTDKAVEFIEGAHDRPFLLGVSLHNPHDICHWNRGNYPDRLDAFGGGEEALPDNFDVAPDEPEFIDICRNRERYGECLIFTRDWSEAKWRQYLYAYHRFVEWVDERVGRVTAALREAGLDDDTVVIFTSDHGEGMAAHRWVVKLSLYEEPTRVPLIVTAPGRAPEGVMDERRLTSGLDVLPTMLDYAGVEAPPSLLGQSLKRLIDDPSAPGPELVVTELHPDPERTELEGRMLRTERFKYVAFSVGARPEMFFDLENDPGERRNLIGEAAFAEEIERHRALLKGWMAKTDDAFKAAE